MFHKLTIVLERADIEALHSGEKREFKLGDQMVELFFEMNNKAKFRDVRISQEMVLDTISENPGLRPKQLAGIMLVSIRRISFHITRLRKMKRITNAGGGWRVITASPSSNGHKSVKDLVKNGR